MEKELTKKEKQITKLYLETTLEVGKNVDNWISFLKRAGYNYKYRFDEQILIYAQKPDAIACAETEIWNKKLKRWINKGAKGIALITERNGELGLRFVFDVTDTNSNVYNKKLKLWKAEEQYSQDIIEALEDKFGKMESKESLGLAIISTSYNLISENIQDYFEDLKTVKVDSNLENIDEEKLKQEFMELVMFSAIALIMSRCGIDINEYMPKDIFSDIEKFNTLETMSVLGTATRDFSKEILLEISKTILNVQKQEKNKNYTFEENKIKEYDKENLKGSVENEYNLYRERKLSNTRLDIDNKQESTIREISENEVTVPKREQEGNVHNINREQQVDRTLNTNRENSQRENKLNDRTNETRVWNNRGNEEEQSNGMGRSDEQYSSNSRTDSNKRIDTNIEEQENDKEADNASFFNSKTIRNILENAPKVLNEQAKFGNFIYDNHEDIEKCKEYIKDILGNAYTEYEVDGERVGYKVNEDSLNIWRGNYLNRTEECFKDWDTIAKYCIVEHLHYAIPKINTDTYTFLAGDIIHIGLKEFTIIDINNESLTMYDNEFPLDRRTVVIKDIMEKVIENPMNDYLKERKPNEQQEKQESEFDKWLDTFIEEKGIDLNEIIEIKTENNVHYFEIGNVVENIKNTTEKEQNAIKDTIVKIDFNNGNVVDYFRHLAQALAKNFERDNALKNEQENEQETEQEEQTTEEMKEQINLAEQRLKKKTNQNIEYFDLHPEIPAEERSNFKITDDNLGTGALKEKYKNNIEAIKVLKRCEEQNRYATKEEQQILSKYVGWGGLKVVFDEREDSWSNEYNELKNLFTDDEYQNARESSLTAYYTPPVVIRNIYKALQNMGLKKANILEPSCRSR